MMTNESVIAPFTALPWQIPVWHDKSPVIVITGSAGGGKSRIVAEKLHAFCKKYPGAMALMLRKTRSSMANSTVLFVDRTIVAQDPGVEHFPSRNRFEYANGSILAYGGMADEKQREQIRSIGQEGGVDIVWMEEATGFVESDFNELLARMRGTAASWRQILLTTNPSHAQHWIYTRLIQGQEATVYRSSARDNPHNPQSYIESLDKLTGILRDRLRDGLWKSAEGVVYDNFNEENWTTDEPDPEKPIELAIDEGYVDPCAVLFIQRQPTRILVFDELYHTGQLAEGTINDIRDKCKTGWGGVTDWPLPEIAIIGSESVEWRERLRRANIPARGGTHRILEGIPVVRRLICDGQGTRALHVVAKRCTNLVNELMGAYQYPAEDKRRGEKPIDKDNHAADALRMWCWMRARR